MLSLRRYAVYFALAAAVLLSLNYFRTATQTRYSSQPPEITPEGDKKYWLDASGPEEVHLGGREFNWTSVHQHFPVKGPYMRPPNTGARTLPKVQFTFPVETAAQTSTRKERQAAVRATFERGWKAYKEHAWMKDELAPLSGGSKDGFGGWAANLVDNLDTLWIMVRIVLLCLS
jgi:mannosyl-oligosaccharide alpha-1,2-mannosidase